MNLCAGGKESLKVAFGDGEYFSLRFGGDMDLDGALALLEHLTSPPS